MKRIAAIARRMDGIAPFRVVELASRARALEAAGRSVVHMEIGESDFTTPQPIVAAGIDALRDGRTHYAPALGLPELRQAIADFYDSRYGVTVPPARVVVTTGSSAALLLALAAVVNPGARVLMTDPGYPCNRHFVRLLEGVPVTVAVGAETGYQLTPELIDRHWTDDTAAVMLASPANPTGMLVAAPALDEIAALVRRRGGTLIMDEIYHGLVYGAACPSALNLSDDAFVINSFSKYFCMTGWRLGWLVVPDAYLDAVERLAQNLFIAAPTSAQYAALAAFAPQTIATLEAWRQEFQARRDFLLPALTALGFGVRRVPDGAFYIYADCNSVATDSYAFAHDLLERAGVAVTPGIDFGEHRAANHVRFAYTCSMDRLQDGVARIADYLHARRASR
jgi:aspartate/methionine/tyrosine aminotransferase